MAKRYTRINWQDKPSTATPISAKNLNKMDKGIKDCDDAIGDLVLLKTNNKTDLVSAINEQNNNLGNIRNKQYSLSAGGTLTISHSGSLFTCLVVAQGTEASLWGSYILHGYGPGTTLRNHIITLGAGEGISVSISGNSFIITNLKPNLDVAVNITLLLGSIISVT